METTRADHRLFDRGPHSIRPGALNYSMCEMVCTYRHAILMLPYSQVHVVGREGCASAQLRAFVAYLGDHSVNDTVRSWS